MLTYRELALLLDNEIEERKMSLIKITWNRSTQTYTVSSPTRIVRNIPVKSQADAVKLDLRYGWDASFGDEE